MALLGTEGGLSCMQVEGHAETSDDDECRQCQVKAKSNARPNFQSRAELPLLSVGAFHFLNYLHLQTHKLIHTYILTYYKCTLSHYSKRWRLSRPGKPTHQPTDTDTNTCIKYEQSSRMLDRVRCCRCFVAFAAFVNERSTHSVVSLTRSFTKLLFVYTYKYTTYTYVNIITNLYKNNKQT